MTSQGPDMSSTLDEFSTDLVSSSSLTLSESTSPLTILKDATSRVTDSRFTLMHSDIVTQLMSTLTHVDDTTGYTNTSIIPPIDPRVNASRSIRLQELNDEKARLYIPVIVYMAVLLIVGTLGNIVVLIVYADQKRKSSSDYFILSLSILDLISCLLGMPTEIYDLLYPYLFYSAAACKILRFTESGTIVSSALILVVVAFDRYFRICNISRVLTASVTKKICVVVIIVSFVLCIPCAVIFGIKTAKTRVVGVTGFDCSVEDSIQNTIYPILWYAFFMLAFIVSLVMFTVLYSRIGYEVWKRKKIIMAHRQQPGIEMNPANRKRSVNLKAATAMRDDVIEDTRSSSNIRSSTNVIGHGNSPGNGNIHGDANNPGDDHNINNAYNPDDKNVHEDGISDDGHIPVNINIPINIPDDNIHTSVPNDNPPAVQPRIQPTNTPQPPATPTKSSSWNPRRTTLILFLVTLVFALSFLPFLVVNVLRSAIHGYEESMSDASEVLHKFLIKSLFINNSVNPLIYSFLNATFRRRAARKLNCLWRRRKRSQDLSTRK